MVFTRIAIVVAWITVVLSCLSMAASITAIVQPGDTARAISERAFGGGNPWRAFELAFLIFVGGLALGVLTEISRAIMGRYRPDRL